MDQPLRKPFDQHQEIDRALQKIQDTECGWHDDPASPFWLSPDDEIPFFVLIMAARGLGRRP
ncbi:hypothetical protein, partial [Streptomyces cellostaticus]|uniref:hypothetical protein n=1 Tax=Streptomyces cellostaticus TaxID=67285 RepID=UPI001ABF6261